MNKKRLCKTMALVLMIHWLILHAVCILVVFTTDVAMDSLVGMFVNPIAITLVFVFSVIPVVCWILLKNGKGWWAAILGLVTNSPTVPAGLQIASNLDFSRGRFPTNIINELPAVMPWE